MTDKNVQLKDNSGNSVYPVTKGALVTNNSGNNLGGVEAGAQVNLIESITVNGNAVSVVNKTAAITVADAEYTMAKKATAETGYFASYYLTKDGTKVGEYINIPKDFLVKSASMGICETAGVPETTPALAVGDPYLDFVINAKDSSETASHIYINVKALVDTYTAGNGLDLNNGAFSVDTTDTTIVDAVPTANSTKFVQSGGVYTALSGKQNTIDASHKISADLIDDSEADNKFVSTSEKTTWNGKQDALSASNKLNADYVEEGSTNTVLTKAQKAIYDGVASDMSNKADKATTLAGYGITDGITWVEVAD